MRHGQDNAILKSIQGVKREGGLVKIRVPESCQSGIYFEDKETTGLVRRL
jgi:hypothetical protein